MIYRVLLFVCLSAFVWSCKESTSASATSRAVAFTKEGTVQIYQQETGSLMAEFDIEFARTAYEIETGLMHRNSMEDSQGMLFIFEASSPRFFYMKNTRIPLDIIYLSEEKTIVSFHKNAQPFDETTLPSEFPAKYVLEINAGLIDELGIALGDQLEFQNLP